ncbi:MAG TPA: CHAP domain-containing protein [Candidatus Saccharimonadales bacterium]|jgi:peptidoglycan hydrolase CwlO-like protein|nr:CHAP domain-containing protein [Candidatus Saccharimonadales bacterium]
MPHKTEKPAFKRLRIALMMLALASLASVGAVVHADQYDSQIQALQNQNSQTQNTVSGLQAQAGSYQGAINILQGQISALQAALAANQAKQTDLQNQITDAQNKITEQKALMGEVIKAMYIDGQMSTIEELATSKNLSDYVDQEENRTAVQNKIDSLIQQIAALQVQLQQQKAQLDILVKTEQQQNDQLTQAQAQQQQMLAYNQGQQAAYNAQIASNQSQIASLRAAQAAANRRLDSSGQVITSGSCGGGYPATASGSYGPWGCNYAHTSDDVPGCSYQDSWGMCNRECVSYTAWMVYQTYGISTVGFGNASDWPTSARRAGIPTGSTPKVGSVAILVGGLGHAMWVVGVSGSQIHVHSYNDGFDGNYYDHWVDASGLTYIYFGG